MPAALPPPDDDRPATRRDLAKEREVIESHAAAEFARVRQELADGLARLRAELIDRMDKGFAALRAELIDRMDKGFAALRAEMATKEDVRSLRRELRLHWAVSLATLAAVLRLSV